MTDLTGCPCLVLDTPCMEQCSCARPEMSGGCKLCAHYGSVARRKARAAHLSAAYAEYHERHFGESEAREPVDHLSDRLDGELMIPRAMAEFDEAMADLLRGATWTSASVEDLRKRKARVYALAEGPSTSLRLAAAVRQAIRDLENYASRIDDSGGTGGSTLRDSARYLRNELDRALAEESEASVSRPRDPLEVAVRFLLTLMRERPMKLNEIEAKLWAVLAERETAAPPVNESEA